MDMHWTVGILCKASGLSAKQLQKLVRDKIITIEEVEVRRDPLLGRSIPASTPLPLTSDQQNALDNNILLNHATFLQVRQYVMASRLPLLAVKNKTAPLDVWSLLGLVES